MKKHYALTFTIGGVQDYIAASRKIWDLWSGSFLISYLTSKAIKALLKDSRCTNTVLVFPDKNNPLIKQQADEAIFKTSIPNKFLAIAECDESDIRQVCKDMEKAVRDTYGELLKKPIKDIPVLNNLPKEEQEKLISQESEWIECYWLAKEISEDLGNLNNPETRKKTVAKLQANLGLELAMLKNYRTVLSRQIEEKETREQDKCSLCGKRVARIQDKNKKHEKLCLNCYAKRKINKTIPECENIRNNGKPTHLDNVSTRDFSEVKYYAIYQADGDSMGDTVKDNPEELSKKLLDFSNAVWQQEPMADKNATLIYCGGDDVLYFSDVKSVLDIACDTNKLFGEKVRISENDKTLTMSAGIHISHNKESMSLALENARRAEKASKDAGKDRFTISVDKRSGDFVSWTAKNWKMAAYFKYMANVFRKDDVSTALYYQLRDELSVFAGDRNAADKNQPAAIPEEQLRNRIEFILGRRFIGEDNKEAKKQTIQKILAKENFPLSSKKDIWDLLDFLEVAAFFARLNGKEKMYPKITEADIK